jgi:hypothetical protein
MGRAFDATGSYERILLQFGVITAIVARLMLLLPRDAVPIELPPERTV